MPSCVWFENTLSMKKYYFLASLILGFLAAGCQQDDELDNMFSDLPTYPANAQLKQVTTNSLYGNDDEARIVEVYDYDANGRVIKTSRPNSINDEAISDYKTYAYDDEGRLSVVASYVANLNAPDGFLLIEEKSIAYSSEGLKIRETFRFPEINTSEERVFLYNGEVLSKVEYYNNSKALERFAEMEYDTNGRLVKERYYSADDEELIDYGTHSYKNGLLDTSISYTANKEVIREVRRAYDKNGNLVALASINVAPWLSSVSYKLTYEYQ